MFNFKHVTILLIAVFISLGIGIAVGFTANSDKLLIEQQKAIIDELEKSYNVMKETTRLMDKELKLLAEKQNKDNEFLEESFETLLRGSLTGKKGIILQLGNKGDAKEIIKYLEAAGAVVQDYKILADSNKEFDDATIKLCDFAVVLRTEENQNPNLIARRISDEKPVAVVQSSNLPPLDLSNTQSLYYIDNIDTIIGKYKLIVWLINNT